MSAWNSKDAEKATNGKSTQEWVGGKLFIDSRKVAQGGIFIALAGNITDGHEFIESAAKNGAASAIVSKNVSASIPTLVVKDTEKALNDLASYRREEAKAKIIAVTGSVGKTSTKEMLAMSLAALGVTQATEGNYNNHLGLPITLASLSVDTEFGVFELGMNHQGELDYLSNLLKPDIAIITTVAPAHLEFFNSVEDIAFAKSEVFRGMKEGSIAVLNVDNEYYYILESEAKKRGLKIVTVGKNGDSKIINIEERNDSGSSVEASICGDLISFNLGTSALHMVQNAILVLTAVKVLGLDVAKAASALANFSGLVGRGAKSDIKIDNKKVTLIDDSYNASPASVRAALNYLGKNSGRKVAILADMLELGGASAELHKSLEKEITTNAIDIVLTYGNLMNELNKILPKMVKKKHFLDLNSLKEYIKKILDDGDTVLIKGSFGTKLYEIIPSLV